jgi:hypothetical protein
VTNLRELARGEKCQVRLNDICNGNPETTVLAHYRLIGLSGMSFKSPDICGAFACSACHDAIDRRSHLNLDRDFVQLMHLQGVVRTLAILEKRGVLKW